MKVRFVAWLLVFIIVGVSLDSLPDYSQLADYQPPVVTRIQAGDGRLLAEYATEKRVFVPGRAGEIWVYQQTDPDHYNLISKIPTVVGAGTAGYFGRQGKGFDRFYLAVSAAANSNAEVRIYTLQD